MPPPPPSIHSEDSQGSTDSGGAPNKSKPKSEQKVSDDEAVKKLCD